MDLDFVWRSRAERRHVVDFLWDAQRGLCCMCGGDMQPHDGHGPDAASIEHLTPKRDGGTDAVGNLRLAHRRCNNQAGAQWEIRRRAEVMGAAHKGVADHAAVWAAIDKLAERCNLSSPGLAKKAGLDATSFNPSRRFRDTGHPRWPSTEAVSRVLSLAGATWHAFAELVEGGRASTPASTPANPTEDAWQPTHRHYKGGLYRLVHRAVHSETEEALVVYESADRRVWVRPAAMFDEALPDGQPRFEPLPAPAEGTGQARL